MCPHKTEGSLKKIYTSTKQKWMELKPFIGSKKQEITEEP
jgi:hypothetical protein